MKSQGITTYLKSIEKYVALSKIEEREIGKRIKAGDKDAIQDLVLHNLLFVVYIVNLYYQPSSVDKMELIQEGNVGLLMAAEKFDYTRGYKFITYAIFYIKQRINKYIEEQTSFIRFPVNNLKKKIFNTTDFLTKELGRDPNFSEIAKYLDKTVAMVSTTVRAFPVEIITTENLVSDINMEENTYKKQLAEKINFILGGLRQRDRFVIVHRFGLNNNPHKSLIQLAKILGITHERVRQIENKALRLLQKKPLVISLNNENYPQNI